MKRIFIVTILLLLFPSLNNANPHNDKLLTIYLEYEIPSDAEFIFSEETIIALVIEEIKADNTVINTFSDIRDIPLCTIKYQQASGKIGKIKMVWKKRDCYFVWNDGRGIFFIEDENGFFLPQTNSYRFSNNTKTLEKKYKVLLPTKNINLNDLMDSLPKDGRYSPVYTHKEILK